jgi:hypothetical protein
MSLNLGAINPMYASLDFENLYIKHLAENMTNENWLDISLEQRMWISRYVAFKYLCERDKCFQEFMIADLSQMKMKYSPNGITPQHSTQPLRKHTDGNRKLNVLQNQPVRQRHVLCPI